MKKKSYWIFSILDAASKPLSDDEDETPGPSTDSGPPQQPPLPAMPPAGPGPGFMPPMPTGPMGPGPMGPMGPMPMGPMGPMGKLWHLYRLLHKRDDRHFQHFMERSALHNSNLVCLNLNFQHQYWWAKIRLNGAELTNEQCIDLLWDYCHTLLHWMVNSFVRWTQKHSSCLFVLIICFGEFFLWNQKSRLSLKRTVCPAIKHSHE